MRRWGHARLARAGIKENGEEGTGREWKRASSNRRRVMMAGSGGGWWLVVGGCCAMNFSGYIDCVCARGVNPRRLLVCRPWLSFLDTRPSAWKQQTRPSEEQRNQTRGAAAGINEWYRKDKKARPDRRDKKMRAVSLQEHGEEAKMRSSLRTIISKLAMPITKTKF